MQELFNKIDIAIYLPIHIIAWTIIALLVLRKQIKHARYVIIMAVWHFTLATSFLIFSSEKVSDSYNYYIWSQDPEMVNLGLSGSSFIINLVWLLRHFTIDNYVFLMLLFAGLSFVGIVSIYSTFVDLAGRRIGSNGRLTIWLIFMLPGLHFWTSAIGKDSLVILAFSLMLGIIRYKNFLNKAAISTGLVLCFLVRPHIGIAIVFSALVFYVIYYPANNSKKYLVRTVTAVVLVGVTLGGYYFLLDSIQRFSSGGFSDIGEFIDSRQDIYAGTSSGIDLSQYPVWAKFVIFLLGVVPTSISGILQVVALLEGLVIVGMVLYVIIRLKISWFRSRDQRLMCLFFFLIFIVVAFILSLLAGNQGLAVRQRVMAYIPLSAAFICSMWAVAEVKISRKVHVKSRV